MEQLVGYAAIFDAFSLLINGDFLEVIRPGAFAASLRTADVRFLWNHDTSHPLGRTSAGNLRLSEDAKGLKFELDLPDTGAAKDLLELVSKRIVSQMSFGFVVPANGDTWKRAGHEGFPIRELIKISIQEVSSTAFPAYLETSIAVRVAAQARQAHPASYSASTARRRLHLALVG